MAQDTQPLTGNWNYPTSIWFGSGRLQELPDACRQLGMQKPLLVTDAGLAQLPMVNDAVSCCARAGVTTRIFSDVRSNPNAGNITAGITQFTDGGHDGVIALGGGSALDAGKAIAFMAGQTRPLWDFEDIGDNWRRADVTVIAPVVAIPTTAGTGSEVGRASVIVDDSAHLKKIIFHPRMLPQIVIADPQLSVGLPRPITAATGMDALSHNLEAYCAPGYHPMADGIALEGLRLIKNWLTVACNEPGNLDARGHMLVASSMGATAFQKGLGATHALAHPLGALYDAHHGLLNAILMPYVLQRNREAIETKMYHLALCLELDNPGFQSVLTWLVDLRSAIGIPDCLADIGIDDGRATQIGNMAIDDPSAAGNPLPLTAQDYATLFSQAVNGRLT